ncbi:hypothetical protein GCM10029992_15800 [Glycomyces albus]
MPSAGGPPQPPHGPQSDDTQRLIIGAQSPQSEPPPVGPPGYGPQQSQPEQAMQQPGQMPPGSQPGQYGQPGQYTQPGQPAAGYDPNQMPPGSVPPGQMPPGAMGGQYPPQQQKSGRKWLVPTIVIGVVVLLGAAAAGAYFMFQPPSFETGGCVSQTNGDTAEAIDCEDAVEGEDFEIVSEVDDGQECADAGRETLTVGDADSPEAIYCLSPYGSDPDESGEDADEDGGGQEEQTAEEETTEGE